MGYPGVAVGRSPTTAWAVSNTKTDNIDFYLEKLNEDKSKYYHDGQWKDVQVRIEKIKVRGRETPVEFPVYSTHHGPVFKGLDDYSKLGMIVPGLIPASLENISVGWGVLLLPDSSHEFSYRFPQIKTGE